MATAGGFVAAKGKGKAVEVTAKVGEEQNDSAWSAEPGEGQPEAVTMVVGLAHAIRIQ